MNSSNVVETEATERELSNEENPSGVEWFYVENNHHKSAKIEEMQVLINRGYITPTTLVWNSDLDDWKKAIQTELKHLFATITPPPIPRIATQVEFGNTLHYEDFEYVHTDAFINTSGQGNIFDNSVPVPPQIKGWNWGAFFLGIFWCIDNHIWIGIVFFLIPIVSWIIPFILAIKGNEWAWKSRKWKSIKEFKERQRIWRNVSFVISGSLIFLLYCLFVFSS